MGYLGTNMNTDTSWRSIYVVGGIAALLALAGTLSDIVLAIMPGWEASTVPATIQAWFTQLETKPLLGLRNLDLLNGAISIVQIPVILALLSRGAHGAMGIFLGVLLSSRGTLLMGLVILTGRIFSRFTGWAGIVGIGLLMIYTIVFTFVPEPGPAMMVFAVSGGILMIIWNVLIARKLFQLRTATGS